MTYENLAVLDYHRDVLPELLWLEAVLDSYGVRSAPGVVYSLLDVLDEIAPASAPFSGLVSSFAEVPEDKRALVCKEHAPLVERAVLRPFCEAVRLYEKCPMGWLLRSASCESRDRGLDTTIAGLKRWTSQLLDRTGEHANMARALALARYAKAGRVHLADKEMIAELGNYPECRERGKVDSFIRATFACLALESVRGADWPEEFWTTNGRVSMCEPGTFGQAGGEEDSHLPNALSQQSQYLMEAARQLAAAVESDYRKIMPDPYHFSRGSVLGGLLARATALALDLLTERACWRAELGGTILRCLCEILVLVAWLLSKDDHQLCEKFVHHSLGQLDLYGLKMKGDEAYREAFKAMCLGSPAETQTADSFDAQLRSIELGNWAGTDTRTMAIEGNTKLYYDLVFSKFSLDVHAQFISLARWNMVPCLNPLHNQHLLPAFNQRTFNPLLPLTGCILLKELYSRFFRHYCIEAGSITVLDDALTQLRCLWSL
jgi:hypothetical protein